MLEAPHVEVQEDLHYGLHVKCPRCNRAIRVAVRADDGYSLREFHEHWAERHARREVLKLAKATIYRQGEFGFNYHALEVRDLVISIGPYAQFRAAVFAEFTPKGARRARGFVQTTHATLTVLEGWGHTLKPDGMYGEETRTQLPSGDVVTMRSSAMSCDASWNDNFRAKLRAYCETKRIKPAADFHGHNPHEAP